MSADISTAPERKSAVGLPSRAAPESDMPPTVSGRVDIVGSRFAAPRASAPLDQSPCPAAKAIGVGLAYIDVGSDIRMVAESDMRPTVSGRVETVGSRFAAPRASAPLDQSPCPAAKAIGVGLAYIDVGSDIR